MSVKFSFTINGKSVEGDVEDRTLLVQYIRENLGLTGTHVGCDTTQCGCCTVHIDGTPMKSCTMLAVQADGCEVTTIEGLDSREGKAIQAAWDELAVAQCGYCQSGQIMSATALLKTNPTPNDADIDAALSGNICRCATYTRIRNAVKHASHTISVKEA